MFALNDNIQKYRKKHKTLSKINKYDRACSLSKPSYVFFRKLKEKRNVLKNIICISSAVKNKNK